MVVPMRTFGRVDLHPADRIDRRGVGVARLRGLFHDGVALLKP
jgi:hypothetical protein